MKTTSTTTGEAERALGAGHGSAMQRVDQQTADQRERRQDHDVLDAPCASAGGRRTTSRRLAAAPDRQRLAPDRAAPSRGRARGTRREIAEPSQVHREDVAADREDQQEEDELDRLPVASLGRTATATIVVLTQHDDLRREDEPAGDVLTTFSVIGWHYGRSLGKTAVWGALLASNIRPDGAATAALRISAGAREERRLDLCPVRPFGRLLASYTVNELGDSVGDRRAGRPRLRQRPARWPPTAALFLAGKFVPALIAPVLTARLDQLAVRRILPWLYVVEALVFVALAWLADGRFSSWRWSSCWRSSTARSPSPRARSRAARSRASSSRSRLLREGNALLNVGFAVASVGGAALAGLLISEFGALGWRCSADAVSFLAIAIVLRSARATCPAARVSRSATLERFRSGLAFARRNRASGCCSAASRSR